MTTNQPIVATRLKPRSRQRLADCLALAMLLTLAPIRSEPIISPLEDFDTFPALRTLAIEIETPAVSWNIEGSGEAAMQQAADRLEQAGLRPTLVAVDDLATRLAQLDGVEKTLSIATLAKRVFQTFNDESPKAFALPTHPFEFLMVLTPLGQYTHLTNADNSRLWIDVTLRPGRLAYRSGSDGGVDMTVPPGTLAAITSTMHAWQKAQPKGSPLRARPVAHRAQAAVIVRSRSGSALDDNALHALRDATDAVFSLEQADPALVRSLITPDMRTFESRDGAFFSRSLIPSDTSAARPFPLQIAGRAELEKRIARTPAAAGVIAPDRRSTLVIAPLGRRSPQTATTSALTSQLERAVLPLRARYGDDVTFFASVIALTPDTSIGCDGRLKDCH